MSSYNFQNFHDDTFAVFHKSEAPDKAPDFVSDSGSQYWNDGNGVFRKSNHWGSGINSNNWFIGRSRDEVTTTDQSLTGYISYSDIQPITSKQSKAVISRIKTKKRKEHRDKALEPKNLPLLLEIGPKGRPASKWTSGRGSWTKKRPVPVGSKEFSRDIWKEGLYNGEIGIVRKRLKEVFTETRYRSFIMVTFKEFYSRPKEPQFGQTVTDESGFIEFTGVISTDPN